jgi:hypothetical protein
MGSRPGKDVRDEHQQDHAERRRSVVSQLLGPEDYVLPLIGVLALGMVAGAGVALLFAPATGKKLREEIESKLAGLKSRLILEEPERENVQRNNVRLNQATS